MEKNKLSYGIGLDYLSTWSTNEALREIYQNFIDFGEYTENIIKNNDNGTVYVCISNKYEPKGLEFLRIGNSDKKNSNSIGKHGEGLKMALLVFLRNKYSITINTTRYRVNPVIVGSNVLGDCFGIEYVEIDENFDKHLFTIEFVYNSEDFFKFYNNIIRDKDKIFTSDSYGSIVNKEKGNIYSGGLFVRHMDNYTKAYDILPRHLELDRDRSMPNSFDVSWYSSKINEAQGKWSFRETNANDVSYIDDIPDDILEEVEPILVESTVEFIYKDDNGDKKIIKNTNITDVLKKKSIFRAIIDKLREKLFKHLSVYELLIEFKNNHVRNSNAIKDFDYIINKVKENEK